MMAPYLSGPQKVRSKMMAPYLSGPQKVRSDKWPSATDGANGWRAGSSEKAAGISTALEPSRTQDGHGLQHAQTDSSFLRPHRVCGADAEPHRGPEELLRGLSAAHDRAGQAHPVGPAGGLPRRVPDQGLRRARQPRIREVRIRRAEVRRRRMPAAWH